MARTKVIANRNGWRRLLCLFVFTLAWVILTFITQPWTDYTRPARTIPNGQVGSSSVHVGTLISLLVLLPSVLIALSWSEQRWWYAGIEASLVWLGMLTGAVLWWLWNRSPGFAFSGLIPACIALVVIYVPARLISLAIVRFGIVSITYQDGHLCTSCAYNLTGNTSGVCPECGEAVLLKVCKGIAKELDVV